MREENDCADRLAGRVTLLAGAMESSSLYLLRAIEETLGCLQSDERLAEAVAAEARRLAGEIRAALIVKDCYLDPEDEAISRIEAGYRPLEERLPTLLTKKASIDRDTRLDREQCELLHMAYERCIGALVELVEASKELRAAIISHDLSAEPPSSETFDSAEALIDSLHAHSS